MLRVHPGAGASLAPARTWGPVGTPPSPHFVCARDAEPRASLPISAADLDRCCQPSGEFGIILQENHFAGKSFCGLARNPAPLGINPPRVAPSHADGRK